MVRYDVAVNSDDEAARDQARWWLLTYNQGDVEATLAIRDWLEHQGAELPTMESLDAQFVRGDSRLGAPAR
jgi:predicted RecB family nuclease